MRYIAHIDMDAFFASVEQMDHPEYRGKPVVVGGNPFKGRGVVSSASYEARRYGIRSAMPIRKAYRLCPFAVFLRPRFHRYEQVFWQIAGIFFRFTPSVELASIDEAYIDLTGTQRLHGDPVETALRIKRTIRDEVGLTASVGVAPNNMLAKMASERGKPDGFVVIRQEEVRDFLNPLPVTALPGIGEKFAEQLGRLGIHKIEDVLNFPENLLIRIFGKAGSFLYHSALGIDDTPVRTTHERKSLSHEHTFDRDVDEIDRLQQELLLLCDRVAERMLEYNIVGRTVSIKVRYADFTTITRSTTLATPTRSNRKIFECAHALLKSAPKGKIRLLGVSVSHLTPFPEAPLDLFRREGEPDESLMKAIAEIRKKYGTYGIVRGFEV